MCHSIFILLTLSNIIKSTNLKYLLSSLWCVWFKKLTENSFIKAEKSPCKFFTFEKLIYKAFLKVSIIEILTHKNSWNLHKKPKFLRIMKIYKKVEFGEFLNQSKIESMKMMNLLKSLNICISHITIWSKRIKSTYRELNPDLKFTKLVF